MTRSLAAVLIAVAVVFAGCGGGTPTTTTTTRAPSGLPEDFVGLVSEDAFAAKPPDRAKVLKSEYQAGARILRQVFDWSQIERTPGRYDFSAYDAFVGDAARAGLRVLPVLFRPPRFEAAKPQPGARVTATTTFPPKRPDLLAGFASAAVNRYGPDGDFWREHKDVPKLPIRSWQVWNEPNLPQYWGGKPDVKAYVALQRAVYKTIHFADPKAEVVSAGIPNSRQGEALLSYLRRMLADGGSATFDTLAIHPYAGSAEGVLQAVRDVRRTLGSPSKRIWITEMGWASEGPHSVFTVGADAQASLISTTVAELARIAPGLGLRGFVYFAWRDAPPFAGGHDFWGLHTGLLRGDGTPKPALAAYTAAAKQVTSG